jgi:hypothetical protein
MRFSHFVKQILSGFTKLRRQGNGSRKCPRKRVELSVAGSEAGKTQAAKALSLIALVFKRSHRERLLTETFQFEYKLVRGAGIRFGAIEAPTSSVLTWQRPLQTLNAHCIKLDIVGGQRVLHHPSYGRRKADDEARHPDH